MSTDSGAALGDGQGAAPASVQRFLELVVERGATDLHLSAESPPLIRIDGELTSLPFPPLSANETKNLCYSLLTDSHLDRCE